MPKLTGSVAWWRSLYFRIGVSFVVFVVVMAVIQGLLVTSTVRRDTRDPRLWPHAVAMDTALAAGRAMGRGETFDVARWQREHYPAWPQIDIVMRDGRSSAATTSTLPKEMVAYANQILHGATPGQRMVPTIDTPFLTAPIQHDGVLFGLVILRFPKRTLFEEAARLISIPGLLVLALATAVASWAIFTPARRRLSALECAAERMREGDLQARAAENGGDEIATVAQAFNRMGEQIAERDEALRTADRRRRQMLADVSHELKTPLTAMRGFIETLQMPQIAADATRSTRYFATLERETRRLERLVADLLDVARLENGVIDFDSRVFATHRLFDQVARRNEPAAAEAGVAIRTHVDDEADQVCGDPHRLEQAVDNLVANALRFTPRGGQVTMGASLKGTSVAITVADTGPGIAPQHIAHVFDRFYKIDPSRATTQEGSGLGLSIVRAIVERHGGVAEVASEPGRTVFTLLLPIDASPAA